MNKVNGSSLLLNTSLWSHLEKILLILPSLCGVCGLQAQLDVYFASIMVLRPKFLDELFLVPYCIGH